MPHCPLCAGIIENLCEHRPHICAQIAKQGLLVWLLKRIRVSSPAPSCPIPYTLTPPSLNQLSIHAHSRSQGPSILEGSTGHLLGRYRVQVISRGYSLLVSSVFYMRLEQAGVRCEQIVRRRTPLHPPPELRRCAFPYLAARTPYISLIS